MKLPVRLPLQAVVLISFKGTDGMTTQHAKYRPPSAAARWLSCHGSATVVYMYNNDESEAAIKGTLAHTLLEQALVFGIQPDTDDPDMDLSIRDAYARIQETRSKMAPNHTMLVERSLNTPHTGEIGTPDVVLADDRIIEVIDFKNGYVPVEIKNNAQLMTYLVAAIAILGERKKYRISVYQPNYDHVDGPYRSIDVTPEQVEWFETEMIQAVRSETFYPGTHCKSTYCKHRGNCKTFLEWCKNNAQDAWYPHEINATSDEELAQALDHAETVHGLRDELRKQAIVRIMQHGKRIDGYKCVRARSQRDFAGEDGKVACFKALLDMGYAVDDLVERNVIQVGNMAVVEQKTLTVAGVERMVKQKYKNFGRGKWKEIFDEHIKPHIREFSGSITLDRTINGRPSVTPGSEFTPLIPTQEVGKVTIV